MPILIYKIIHHIAHADFPLTDTICYLCEEMKQKNDARGDAFFS